MSTQLYLSDNKILAWITWVGQPLLFKSGLNSWKIYRHLTLFSSQIETFQAAMIWLSDKGPGWTQQSARLKTAERISQLSSEQGAQWGLARDLTCADPSVEIGVTSHALGHTPPGIQSYTPPNTIWVEIETTRNLSYCHSSQWSHPSLSLHNHKHIHSCM